MVESECRGGKYRAAQRVSCFVCVQSVHNTTIYYVIRASECEDRTVNVSENTKAQLLVKPVVQLEGHFRPPIDRKS